MNELCTGCQIIDRQCPNPAKWVNQNGVKVCDFHKLQIDAFGFEGRNNRIWTPIELTPNNKLLSLANSMGALLIADKESKDEKSH